MWSSSKQECIIQQGDVAESCYVLLKGSVGVWVTIEATEELEESEPPQPQSPLSPKTLHRMQSRRAVGRAARHCRGT